MNDPLQNAREVKQRYEAELLNNPAVTGVGVGYRMRNGEYTDEVVIVVTVANKRPEEEVQPDELIPTNLDGVPVDVQEGTFSS